MAKKARSPALYELIKTHRRGSAPAEPRPRAAEPAPPAEPAGGSGGGDEQSWLSLLTPGRSITVPVGYVLVAGATMLVFVIAAYVFGYARAENAMESTYEERLLELTGAPDPRRAVDPLADRVDLGGGEPDDGGAAPGVSPRLPQQPRPAGDVVPGVDRWGPLDADPREPGKHYFVISETRPEGAARLARFCRTHGLAAYVVPSNNERFRRVVVLPGLTTRVRTDPEVKRLETTIFEIGRLWKQSRDGESNLRDAYLATHEGTVP